MDKLLLLSLFGLFLGACTSNDTGESVDQTATAFFDLEDYFEQEAIRLAAQSYTLKKQLLIDTKEETQTLETPDFEAEFLPFARLNINQPTWMDKYRVDSIFNTAQQLQAIDYTAIDESMKTNKLIIVYDSLAAVQEISIHNNSSSLIMDAKQFLSYQANKGYSIQTEQDVLLFGAKEILLEAEFIEKK